MPEHVHLLVSEPQRNTLATAVQALKQAVSRQLIGERKHFWQARYYDFNVRTAKKRIEKLRYLHRNPVKRRLVEKPENWEWSSFCNYASGVEGVVETESESLCSVVADCRDSAVMIRRNTRNHRPCLFSIAYCR
jgi:putative transposase